MLSFTRLQDGGVEIEIALPSPTVYLDYGVIGRLAGTDNGGHLRELICAKGTLYLSWVHFMELFSLGNGPTFQKISGFLGSFGPNFVVINPDSESVVKRERVWTPGHQNPALDEGFLHLIAAKWDGQADVSIGVLLEFMARNNHVFEWMKARHTPYKEKIKTVVDVQRKRYRIDRVARKHLDSIKYVYKPPFLTEKISLELTRECIRTNETFTPSDSLDFLHAVVSTSYCDYVVLDKKWARRCRAMDVPEGETAITYDGTQIVELLAALSSERK